MLEQVTKIRLIEGNIWGI